MSRFRFNLRNSELLEPYEWKRSRTVLRGKAAAMPPTYPIVRPTWNSATVGRYVQGMRLPSTLPTTRWMSSSMQ